MKNHSKLCSILTTICVICAMVCVIVLAANLDGQDEFKNLVFVIGFLFGGCLGSYLIAKYVINKDVENEIRGLKESLETKKKEKQTFLKNLYWVITNWELKGVPQNKFNSDKEFKAYIKGQKDAVEELQENYLNRIQFGVIETNTMFTEDWTEN